MADYKVTVGVDIEGKSKLDSLKKTIEGIKSNKVDIDIGVSGASNEVKKLQKEIDSLKKKMNGLGAGSGSTGKSSALNRQIKQLKSNLKELDSLESKLARVGSKSNVNMSQFTAIERQITEMTGKVRSQLSDIRGVLSTEVHTALFDDLNKEAEKANRSIELVEAKVKDMRAGVAQQIISKVDSGETNKNAAKLEARIASLDSSSDRIDRQLQRVYSAEALLKGARASISTNEDLYDVEKIKSLTSAELQYTNAIRTTNNMLDEQIALQRKSANIDKQNVAATKLSQNKQIFDNQVRVWLTDNSAAAAQFGTRLAEIRAQIASVDATGLDNLKSQFRQVTQEAKLAGVAQLNFGDRLKRQATEYASYLGIATVAFEGSQLLQEMAQSVLEVDTAMTGLYRVTDLTSHQYDSLFNNMIASTKEYGTTLTDTINATSDWVRAGFDADTALGLADVSAMYQHVSDLGYDEASDNLLTAYNGFKETLGNVYGDDEVAKLEHIADVYNEIDNQFSVTSAGLGEGISRSASALQLAGNTFEEAVAMIGATSEVTQDPAKAGNAMKILSLRLRGMKGQLQELGEEVDPTVENISKMQGQILNLTGGKVNIFDANGQFRSTFDIMKDIAEVYEELGSTQQADLLETIAGKDRANDVASLLSNFDNAIAMAETAQNADGSAREENEKYVNSLQGRLDIMKASFEAFSNTAMNSDFLKTGVDAISAFIEGLNKLIETFGTIPTLAGAVAAALTFKNIGVVNIDRANNKFQLFGHTLKEIKDIASSFGSGGLDSVFSGEFDKRLKSMGSNIDFDVKQLDAYKKAVLADGMDKNQAIATYLSNTSESAREYARSIDVVNLSTDEFVANENRKNAAVIAQDKSMKNSASIISKYNEATKQGKEAAMDFAQSIAASGSPLGRHLVNMNGAATSMGKYTTSLIAARAATVGLTIAATAMNAALTMGISVAITGLVSFISSKINEAQEIADAVQEVTANYTDKMSFMSDNKSDFDSAVQSYEKLSSGVNKLGENVSLTTEQFQEYQEAVKTIAGMTPSMVAGYDAQGNAILKASANVDTLNEAYSNLIDEPRKELLDKGGDVLKDYFNSRRDVGKDIGLDGSSLDTLEDVMSSDNLDKKMSELTEKNSENRVKYIEDLDKIAKALRKEYEESGIKIEDELKNAGTFFGNIDDDAKLLENAAREHPELVQGIVDSYKGDLEAASEELKTYAQAFLGDAFDGEEFSEMGDSLKTSISNVVSGLDFTEILGENFNKEQLDSYLQSIADSFSGISQDGKNKLEGIFDLQTKYNDGDASITEFSNEIKQIDQILKDSGLDENVRKEYFATLGFEYDSDGVHEFTKDYEDLREVLKKNVSDEGVIDTFLKGLSGEEVAAALEYFPDGFNEQYGYEITGNAEEQVEQLNNLLSVAEALNGVGTIDITVETEGLEKLNAAIQESNSATGLSAESINEINKRYSDLEGFDSASIFEKTTTGVRLNTRALESLEKQYVATRKAASAQELNALAQEYKHLEESARKAHEAGDFANEDKFNAQADALLDTIEQAQLAAAAYDGLTSSYNNWINAQQSGQEGDIYDQIMSGRENAETLAKEGKWGNTELQGYVEMFSPEGFGDNATPEQYAERWNKAIKLSNRYFQEGTAGLDNFFKDVNATGKNLVKMDKNGVWQIQPDVEIEDLAKSIGIANSTVEAILGQANEYGADFEIGIDTKSVDELLASSEKAAKTASDSLKQYMGEDFEIEVKTDISSTEEAVSEIEKLKAQKDEINNSDATVEVKEQGIEAVNSAIEAAIQKKIQLSQPAFMSIDASQVNASLTDAYNKAVDMQNALNNLHILEDRQAAGIEVDSTEIDNARAKVDECAKAIQNLSDGEKVQIGLGVDDTTGEITKAFEGNKIKIPIGADADEAKAAIDAINNDSKIDVVVNLTGDEKIAALESKMNAIDDKPINPTVNLTGEDKIAALESKMNAIDDKKIYATVIVSGDDRIAALESKMNAIDNKPIHATVSVSGGESVDAIKSSINSVQSKQISITVSAVGTVAVSALRASIDSVAPKTVDVTANVSGTPEVNALKSAIDSVYNKSVSVTATAYGISGVQSLANAISSVQSKTVTVTTNYQTNGKPAVNGTANVNGTAGGKAFQKGDWGAKDSGVALMGELGTELIVRGDKWFTVGDDGAGFFEYKKNDIIFNHKQTEELFKNGIVTSNGGRGRAFAEGTAFASVTGGWKPGGVNGSGYAPSTSTSSSSSSKKTTSSKKTSTKKSSTKQATEEAKEFEEAIDWVEIAIDRLERAIDRLDIKASSTFESWSSRASNLTSEISKVGEEMSLQQKAYDRYIKEANSVGLSSSWAKKVREGKVDIETITNEDLKDKIDEYQEWYEKALDAKDAIDELRETERELYQQRFDNVATKFEGIISVIQHEKDMLEGFIDQDETKGYVVSTDYYTALIKNEQSQIKQLEKQKKEMLSEFEKSMASGLIAEGSEAWYRNYALPLRDLRKYSI